MDIRNRSRFPIEAYLQARAAKPSGYAGASALLGGVKEGITTGLQLSDTLDKIKQRNLRAEQLSALKETDEFKNLDPVTKYKLEVSPETTSVPKKEKVTNPYNVLKSSMLAEYQKAPKAFKEKYGDDGMAIIGAKQSSNILDTLIDAGLLNTKE